MLMLPEEMLPLERGTTALCIPRPLGTAQFVGFLLTFPYQGKALITFKVAALGQ
jgi:hypothetical protein